MNADKSHSKDQGGAQRFFFRGSASDSHEHCVRIARLDRLADYIAAAEEQAAKADDEFRSGDAILWDGIAELLRDIDGHIQAAAVELTDGSRSE